MSRSASYRRPSSPRGITLLELLIAIAVISLLAAVTVPNVTGFITRSKSRAYDGDRQTLQVAVDGWRADPALVATRPWPILQGSTACLGTVNTADGALTTLGCNPYLDIGALATAGFLHAATSIQSANTSFNTTATQTPSGSYGWFLNASGVVTSFPLFREGVYP